MSDESFENYYLQEHSLEDEYMSPCFKGVSDCSEVEVISPSTMVTCGTWTVKGKRSFRYNVIDEFHGEKSAVMREDLHTDSEIRVQSRKLGKKTEAPQIDEQIRLMEGRKFEKFDVGEDKGGDFNGGKTADSFAEDKASEIHMQLGKETGAAQKEVQEIRLKKKRKIDKVIMAVADDEKGHDFNGGKTATVEVAQGNNHPTQVSVSEEEERNRDTMPMKKNLKFRIKLGKSADPKTDDINRDSSENHTNGVMKPKEYKCDICGKGFSSYQAVGGHKSSSHPVKLKQQGPFGTLNRVPADPKMDYHQDILQAHTNSDIPKEYKCDICEQSFPSFQALGGHKSGHFYEKQRGNVVAAAPAADNQEMHGWDIGDRSSTPTKPILVHQGKHFEDNGCGSSKHHNLFFYPQRVPAIDLF